MDVQTADVVVFSGVPMILTYAVPGGMQVRCGARVEVPLRTSIRIGVVVALNPAADGDLKDIVTLLDEEPLIPDGLIELLFFCARYYHAGYGACLSLAFPPYLRKGARVTLEPEYSVVRLAQDDARLGRRQLAILQAIPEGGVALPALKKMFPGCSATLRRLEERGLIARRETEPRYELLPPPTYSSEQEAAIATIRTALAERQFRNMLLHGITGSGKTEVYLAASRYALEMGRSVLYLVPEIALTPQTIARVRERIPYEIALFHSGLGARERARQFLRVSRAGVRFVLGTRSAVFAPLVDLGLVVIDEEHDGSYKQSEGVPYNARDLGILRAQKDGAVVVLGSATPSVETYHRVQERSTTMITMSARVGAGAYPAVEVVDMRGREEVMSAEMCDALERTLERGEQSLLFVNRRGFSAAMVCPGCGLVLKCRHCDRSLTYHKGRSQAVCHYCGYSLALPEICPQCGCLDMKPLGLGTERIVAEVAGHLPGARLLKMDSDELDSPAKIFRALDAIAHREVDVVIGTQMTAKGHDFPYLTHVGVLHAEQLLHMPDFRATERTFQQVVQVAGRAGRHRRDTAVIIQTLIPEHPVIRSIQTGDYEAMVAAEEETRRLTGFPPFSHLARCIFTSTNGEAVAQAATQAVGGLNIPGLVLFGPAPAPIAMLRGAFRWHLLLASGSRSVLHHGLSVVERVRLPSAVTLKLDVDPYDMV